jgi:branched-chain amino acid transport system permease protein
MGEFVQWALLGLVVGSLYSLIGLGIVLIFRCSGVINFAQGELLVGGALVIWYFASSVGLPLWASLILGLGGAVLIGFLIEKLFIHPLMGQSLLSIMTMTLALGLFLVAGFSMIWGSEGRGYPTSYLPQGTFWLGDIQLPQVQLSILLITLVIGGSLYFYLRSSKTGLGMQAVADDSEAAQCVGVRATSVLSLSWILGTVVAAVGGYFLGDLIGIEIPNMPIYGIKAMAIACIGGFQSLGGVMIAGPIIGIVEYLSGGYIAAGFRDGAFAIALLVFLGIRPAGLFGWKKIERI